MRRSAQSGGASLGGQWAKSYQPTELGGREPNTGGGVAVPACQSRSDDAKRLIQYKHPMVAIANKDLSEISDKRCSPEGCPGLPGACKGC